MFTTESDSHLAFGNEATHRIAEALGTNFMKLDSTIFKPLKFCDTRDLPAARVSGAIATDDRKFIIPGHPGQFLCDIRVHVPITDNQEHGAFATLFSEPLVLSDIAINGCTEPVGCSDDLGTREARASARSMFDWAANNPNGNFGALNLELEKRATHLNGKLPNVLGRRVFLGGAANGDKGAVGDVTRDFSLDWVAEATAATTSIRRFPLTSLDYKLSETMNGSWIGKPQLIPAYNRTEVTIRRNPFFQHQTVVCNTKGVLVNTVNHVAHANTNIAFNGEPYLTYRVRNIKDAECQQAVDSVIGHEYRLNGMMVDASFKEFPQADTQCISTLKSVKGEKFCAMTSIQTNRNAAPTEGQYIIEACLNGRVNLNAQPTEAEDSSRQRKAKRQRYERYQFLFGNKQSNEAQFTASKALFFPVGYGSTTSSFMNNVHYEPVLEQNFSLNVLRNDGMDRAYLLTGLLVNNDLVIRGAASNKPGCVLSIESRERTDEDLQKVLASGRGSHPDDSDSN